MDASLKITGTNDIKLGPDDTGEGLNKINMGQRGVRVAAAFGGTGTPTDEDASGAAPVITVGIEGLYVATISPSPGDSLLDVLNELAIELSDHSIPATVDQTDDLLTITQSFPGDENFDFGSTDTGISFFFADYMEVPEPALGGLFAGFAIALLALRRFPVARGSQRARAGRGMAMAPLSACSRPCPMT